MARRNAKYTQEMKEQTTAYILESGQSATKTAKEMGDRCQYGMPLGSRIQKET